MKYQLLTEDQQTQILNARLLQAEADHFQHTLSAEQAEAVGDLESAATWREQAAAAEKIADVVRARLPS